MKMEKTVRSRVWIKHDNNKYIKKKYITRKTA